jgi:hypothetical protein
MARSGFSAGISKCIGLGMVLLVYALRFTVPGVPIFCVKNPMMAPTTNPGVMISR